MGRLFREILPKCWPFERALEDLLAFECATRRFEPSNARDDVFAIRGHRRFQVAWPLFQILPRATLKYSSVIAARHTSCKYHVSRV